MYQLPVNNLARIRKARKQVKRALGDIGLDFCKEAFEDFKEFCPDEQFVKNTYHLDICGWDPSSSKSQVYRSKPFCCTECRFASKYYSGYKNHFRSVHSKTFDNRTLIHCPYCTFIESKNVVETHVKIFHVPSSRPNNLQATQAGKKGKIEKPKQGDGTKPVYFCKKCTFRDTLYNVVRRHIYREHFQHVVAPYLGMVSGSSKKGSSPFSGNNIFCKRCQFSTRSYEVLVQHVVEYHERIGAQVTIMIGHANVALPSFQTQPTMSPKAVLNTKRPSMYSRDRMAQTAIGYLKPLALKGNPTSAGTQVHITIPSRSTAAAKATFAPADTRQTQKWKICTVCNELFPENLYSAHFESAHKARKVWASAKYIMKIHNFTSKCFHCNRYLPSDTLLNHMLIHGLTCPQCHATFHTVEKITEHAFEAHPNEFATPQGVTPLTFELTLKKDKPVNIQLAVLTFNMKEQVNGQNQPKAAQKFSSLDLYGSRGLENEGMSIGQSLDSAISKTVCPLCFTIFKGTRNDALALHLRERHQVLQTMHPVEKKMTYKCIHCLGVYTSNMVASTITLHLVQCRAVGRNLSSFSVKSSLKLNSSGTGFLKRQLTSPASSYGKKMKLDKELEGATSENNDDSEKFALDPRSYEHNTYEARKNFLTAYFNRRPYISSQEEESLSASLWLWKTDISKHFDSKQKLCMSSVGDKKSQVLLGFDMEALKKLKHDIKFAESKVDPSTRKVGRLKPGFTISKQTKVKEIQKPLTSKLNECTETISIDSDNDPEPDQPTENGDINTNHVKHAQCEETVNLLDDSSEEITEISDEPAKEKEISVQNEKTGESTDKKKDESTGDKKDESTGEKKGESTDEKLNENTEEKTGEKIDETMEENTDEKTGEKIDETMEENTEEKTGEKIDETMEENTDEKTGKNTDETMEEKTGENMDEIMEENTDEKTGENTDAKTGENTDEIMEENTDEIADENTDEIADEETGKNTDEKTEDCEMN